MKLTPALLILVFLMSGLGYAKDAATTKGTTILIVKECPKDADVPDNAVCAETYLPVRLVFKLKRGEKLKSQQVLKCGLEKNRNLACEHEVRLELDSSLLPKQE